MLNLNDFTFSIERLANKLSYKITAPQIFSLFEELDWLTQNQLELLIEKLKYEERFPTLTKINQTLQNLNIRKNSNGYLKEIVCEKCGAVQFARSTDRGIVECINVFYEKCNNAKIKI